MEDLIGRNSHLSMGDSRLYDKDLLCPNCGPETHLGIPRQSMNDSWYAPCYTCRKVWKLEKVGKESSSLKDLRDSAFLKPSFTIG